MLHPDPATPEPCSPLDLSSPVILRRLESLIPATIKAAEANAMYSPVTKAAIAYEMRALGANLRNIVALSVAESQLP